MKPLDSGIELIVKAVQDENVDERPITLFLQIPIRWLSWSPKLNLNKLDNMSEPLSNDSTRALVSSEAGGDSQLRDSVKACTWNRRGCFGSMYA